MSDSEEEEVVLGSARIRLDEAEAVLNSESWLEDNIIEFALEAMKTDEFKSEADAGYFDYLSPSVVQLVRMSKSDEVKLLLEPLQLQDKKIILIPVNNAKKNTQGNNYLMLFFESS